MTSEEVAAIRAQIVEAKAVYHQLMLGRNAVSLIDQNGEKVTFSAADAATLKSYIRDLEAQIPGGGFTPTRPVGFIFK